MSRRSFLHETEVRRVCLYKRKGKSEREISKILIRPKTKSLSILSKKQFLEGTSDLVVKRNYQIVVRELSYWQRKKYQYTHKILQQITKKVSNATMWRSLKSNIGVICRTVKGNTQLLKC